MVERSALINKEKENETGERQTTKGGEEKYRDSWLVSSWGWGLVLLPMNRVSEDGVHLH